MMNQIFSRIFQKRNVAHFLAVLALVLGCAGQSAVAQPSGLVAAYGFEEGSGGFVTDASGNGNTGTISEATWAAGKFGSALQFNGTSAIVTVNDSVSLDLTTGATLEAWVF